MTPEWTLAIALIFFGIGMSKDDSGDSALAGCLVFVIQVGCMVGAAHYLVRFLEMMT